MARIVIDANVLISAAFGGTPLDAVTKAFAVGTVCVSTQVVAEVETTIQHLSRKLGVARTRILQELWSRLHRRCELVQAGEVARICRDPKDDAYLALCVSARAACLITGDRDLLVVVPAHAPALPRTLRILTPRQFLDWEP